MNEININLLEAEQNKSKKRRMFFWILAIIFVLGLAMVFSVSLFGSSSAAPPGKPSFLRQLKNLILSSDRRLKGEAENRINILLLGMGGQGHEGAYLTDTIILGSINPSEKKIALLSIPRDLLVNIPGYGFRRINEANAFGELQAAGSGSQLTKQTVEEVTGLPIHYYIRIDFEGFKKMIDEVGSIDVYVERAFTDTKFPTEDFKYRTVSFEKGWQKMDGQTVLDFVRSRHGSNGESTDFARARRQQKILAALKEEIFSFSTLLNPGRLQNLFEDLQNHLQTNLELWEINRFYKLAKNLDYENMLSRVLGTGEGEPLIESQYGSASVLLPRAGNFEEIQRLAQNLFFISPSASKPLPPAFSSLPKIQLQNGTWFLGLAAQAKVLLEEKKILIETVGNAKTRNYEKTLIYDYSNGKFPETAQKLKDELQAPIETNPPPDLLEAPIDFLIILGKDQQK